MSIETASIDRLRLAAGLCLGAGVALGVGGTLLFLLDESAIAARKAKRHPYTDGKPTARWNVEPNAGPGELGIRIRAAF